MSDDLKELPAVKLEMIETYVWECPKCCDDNERDYGRRGLDCCEGCGQSVNVIED